MLRLATIIVFSLALISPVFSSPALAAAPAHDHMVPVMIGLRGFPLAADTNLKARTPATLGRYRLDVTLRSARAYQSQLSAYRAHEMVYLRQHGIHFSVRRQFDILFNGFSATVPSRELARLRALSNVTSVLPIRTFHPLLDRSVALVHGPEAWSQLGGQANAGRGMLIAQIDTGIDVKHPCFRDAGFAAPPFGRRADNAADLALTNNKVVVARAFGSDPSQTYSASDAVGHGTFGAAIEACDINTKTPLGTTVSGVAPAAYVMNYNVFADTQSAGWDTVVAALQAALADGADVANLSLGANSGAGDPKLDYPAHQVDLAVKAGLTVVVSAGNAGPSNQTVSSPAVAAGAIAVGATTNSRGISSTLTVAGPSVPAALSRVRANEGSHPFSQPVGPGELVYVGLGRVPNDDSSGTPEDLKANDYAGKDLHGKIALIQRGNIFFETKINNAAKAGAIGAIIFDNRDELNLFTMDVGKTATLPAMSISQADGQALLKYVQANSSATATLHPEQTTFEEIPNVLSDFSSRGYAVDYSIKPDLVAPGQDIYSATESSTPNNEMYNVSGYTIQQGTSFSAPHVTGAAALVLQKHPKWTPEMVKDALVQTGDNNILLDPKAHTVPSISQMGGGLLNIASAISTAALITPASISLGEVNLATESGHFTKTLSLSDAGNGSGGWKVRAEGLHASANFAVSVPSTVTLPANGHVDIPVSFAVGAGLPNGDYDGYLVLTHGAQTLHVPYFGHVITQAVKPGSVLLVDASFSRFVPDNPATKVPHQDVSSYYAKALTAIGKSYTYWDESRLGAPAYADLKPASAVIMFTGNNLNGYAGSNSNSEALDGPLSSLDLTGLHQYLDAGGRVFVSGLAAGLSDFDFTGCVLGAGAGALSVYDNAANDKQNKGGVSPPQPSAVPDVRIDKRENRYLFAGMKAIDFSTKGDGAGDNVAQYSKAVETNFGTGLVGVTALDPVYGQGSPCGQAFGQAVLRTTDLTLAQGGADVATVSSNEPTLKAKASYAGRAVYFSFGFEGINDNTGFATRAQVLQRIFEWFGDHPTASVGTRQFKTGAASSLKAVLHAASGVRAVQYEWQIGTKTLKASTKLVKYRFPRSGNYRIRVAVTDSLGHVAVSPVAVVSVR